MVPAHDDIATIWWVTVISKVAALELKLDSHSLPFSGGHLSFGFAIGVTCLDGLNVIPQFWRHHPKQENDALFVYWLMTKATKINRIAVSRAPIKLGVALFSGDEGCDVGA